MAPLVVFVVALELVLIQLVLYYCACVRRRGVAPSSTSSRRYHSARGQKLRFAWQLANFGVFATLAVRVWLHGSWSLTHYFTQWNFQLQPFYWLAATCDSGTRCLGRPVASGGARALANGLLEVCLPSAWFVTMVVFLVLEPGRTTILGSPEHFLNTLCLSVDFATNELSIRTSGVIFLLVWLDSYLLFSWLRKAAVRSARWPYFFLALDSADAVLWYALLNAMQLLVYGACLCVSRVKQRRTAKRVVIEAQPLGSCGGVCDGASAPSTTTRATAREQERVKPDGALSEALPLPLP